MPFSLDDLAGNLIGKCPICGASQDQLKISLVEEGEAGHLLFLSCRKCLTNFIAIANFGALGINVVSFATDLQQEEVGKFWRGEEVTSDDILELHQALEDKKVNFIEIIK